jgi:hypothetical protein
MSLWRSETRESAESMTREVHEAGEERTGEDGLERSLDIGCVEGRSLDTVPEEACQRPLTTRKCTTASG